MSYLKLEEYAMHLAGVMIIMSLDFSFFGGLWAAGVWGFAIGALYARL